MTYTEDIVKKLQALEKRIDQLERVERNTFSALNVGTTGAGSGQVFANDDIRIAGGLSVGSVVTNPAGGAIIATGDIYTYPWTDITAGCTITGWSSLTTSQVYAKQIGKLIFISFYFVGTSDSTDVYFSYSSALPVQNKTTVVRHPLARQQNAGTYEYTGFCLTSGSTDRRIIVYRDGGATSNWTNTGTKMAGGFIIFNAE